MTYAVNLVDSLVNSDYGYYIIIVCLALIALCMFFLIFSQFKLIKMHIKDNEKSIEDKIDDIEEKKIDLFDTKELPILKENVFSENRNIVKVENSEDIIDSPNKDNTNSENETPISISELEDLQSITKEIELNPIQKKVELTQYEAEQEERAIISYDELLAKSDNVSIVYSDSEDKDDVLVKKVDLERTGKIELDPIKKEMNSKVNVLKYEHEEAFLSALKDLQNLLN